MRISLNLATRPYADIRPTIKRLRISMAALAVVAIALGIGLHAVHTAAAQARAAQQSLQDQIDAVNRERQGYKQMMLLPANAQLVSQVKALNLLFDQKTFSWTLAMEDLETVLPGGVQVTTLKPVRLKDGPTTLQLRVVGPRDLAVKLVVNLEGSKHFVSPRIVSESAESTGGPGQRLMPVSASDRVNFDLLADYNSAAPADADTKKKPDNQASSADQKSSADEERTRRTVHAVGPAPAIQPRIGSGIGPEIRTGMHKRTYQIIDARGPYTGMAPANHHAPRKPNPALQQIPSAGGQR